MDRTDYQILNILQADSRCTLRHIGSVEEGKLGDLVIWDAPDLDYICYRVGSNLAKTVIKRGEIV